MLVLFSVAAFFFALMAGPSDPFKTITGTIPTDGLGPNVLLQDNPLVAFHPPLLVPRLRRVHGPVRIRSGVPGDRQGARDLAVDDPPLDAACVGLFDRRHRARCVVVVPGPRLGRVLGLGPGRERIASAVALCDRIPALVDRPGAPRTHAGVEPLARHRDLLPDDPRHVPHPLGRRAVRARVLRLRHRPACFSDSSVWSSRSASGLIAWRGDRLRSPGGIDSPLSREGAFVLNNLLFSTFAFIVLLGTVFPLLYEAFRGQQVTVGSPYFDTMTVPLGLALLTLMAVGPVLPWRKTSVTTLRDRLMIPACAGVGVIVVCVAAGLRGLAPLAAFGLGLVGGRRQHPATRDLGQVLAPPRQRSVARPRRPGERRDGGASRRRHGRSGAGGRHVVRAPFRDGPAARSDRDGRRTHASSSSGSDK